MTNIISPNSDIHLPKALIINWGTEDQFIYPYEESLKLHKHDIFLATSKNPTKGIKAMFKPDHLIFTNPYDLTELLKDLNYFSINYKVKFDIITTFFEMNVYEAAVAGKHFQCKYSLSPLSALRTSVDKYLMRSFLNQEKINQPNYIKFTKLDIYKLYESFINFNSSVVIKPSKSGHSYGSRLIDQNTPRNKFSQLVKEAFMEYDYYFSKINSNPIYLMEQYIPGNIYSIDGVVAQNNNINIIGNAEFEMVQPPLLQQAGYTMPIASLNKKQVESCEMFTRLIIKKMGLQYCGFHCELKYHNNKPWLIEIGARLPGGNIIQSYQECLDCNVFDIFWSIFKDKQLFNKKIKFQKSDSQINLFTDKKYFHVIQSPLNSYFVNKYFTYEIKSVNHLGRIYEANNISDRFLLQLRFRSKLLKSYILKNKRDELLKKISIKLKVRGISRIYLGYHLLLKNLKKLVL